MCPREQRLLPGSSQAQLHCLVLSPTCLSTLGPHPQGDTYPSQACCLGLLAVRAWEPAEPAGSTPGSTRAGPESERHVCKRWASRALFWGRPSWLQAWVCSWWQCIFRPSLLWPAAPPGDPGLVGQVQVLPRIMPPRSEAGASWWASAALWVILAGPPLSHSEPVCRREGHLHGPY